MKKIIGVVATALMIANLACATVVRSVQSAETLHVFDAVSPVDDNPHMIRESFAADPASTHAWVEIEVTGDYWDAEQHREVVTLKRHVPGLRYDPKTKEVLIELAGRPPVVCGTYNSGGFFTEARVVPSDQCVFTDGIEERPVDDGYHVKSRPFIMVDLLVKGASAPLSNHSLMGKHP